MGVKDEYAWLRLWSPVDPKAKGDSVPAGSLCGGSFSSSGVGLLRFFFPEDDSDPRSPCCCCSCGVIAPVVGPGVETGGVSMACGLASCGGMSGPVPDPDVLAFLGGGYTSPRAAAASALACASALVGRPRFFLFAGSPTGDMAYAGLPMKSEPG